MSPLVNHYKYSQPTTSPLAKQYRIPERTISPPIKHHKKTKAHHVPTYQEPLEIQSIQCFHLLNTTGNLGHSLSPLLFFFSTLCHIPQHTPSPDICCALFTSIYKHSHIFFILIQEYPPSIFLCIPKPPYSLSYVSLLFPTLINILHVEHTNMPYKNKGGMGSSLSQGTLLNLHSYCVEH